MNDKGVSRTSPAKLSLLKNLSNQETENITSRFLNQQFLLYLYIWSTVSSSLIYLFWGWTVFNTEATI